MLQQMPADHPCRSSAEEVLKAGERAATLTRQLLSFSRRQVLTKTVLNLNPIGAEMHKMLLRLIGADVTIATSFDPDLGNVKADPGQIEQVIMNLGINARDAMPHGGRLTLETANVVLDQSYAEQHPGTKAGPHVMLAVSDTGTGMDQQTLSHLFEPFFTTKEPGKGTGLGLSTVYGIVAQNGGSIWVYSEPGRGSTFKVYFPRIDEPTPAIREDGKQSPIHPGTGTILLVEDSDTVRKLMVQVLTQSGYKLLVASDAEEAFRLLAHHPGPLHLLVTDVVLPNVSGPEIAYQVSRSWPDVKVLFTSGYTDRGIVESGILESGIPFLQKPFGPESLARKVREVLGIPA
jgi:CheY-like chemotaxis protein